MAIRFLNSQSIDGELTVTGNVGIGTTSPDHLLDVQGTTEPTIRVKSTGTGGSDDSSIRMTIGGTTANNRIRFGDATTSTAGQLMYSHSSNAMRFYTSGTEKVRIDSNGKVGIGTTSPQRTLDIGGAGQISFLGGGLTTNSTAGIYWYNDDRYGIYRESGAWGTPLPRLMIEWASGISLDTDGVGDNIVMANSGGNVGIGTTSPNSELHIASLNPVLTLQDTNSPAPTGTKIEFTDSTNNVHAEIGLTAGTSGALNIKNNYQPIEFYTGTSGTSTLAIQIDDNGFVGIGITNPTATLHVNGGLRVATVTEATTYSADKFLVSDAENVKYVDAVQLASLIDPYVTSGGKFVDGTDTNDAVYTTGNVGIGTTDPSTLLEIASGNSGGDAALDSPTFRINNTTQSADWDVDDVVGSIEYYSSDTGGNAPYVTSFIKSVNENDSGTLPSGALTFGTAAYNAIGGAIERLRITADGDVGIGTTIPDQRLDVQDTTSTSIRVKSTGTTATDNAFLRLEIGGTTATNAIAFGSASNAFQGQIRYVHQTNDMIFHGNGNLERMRIDSSGNVGIGTTSPSSTLSVNGVYTGEYPVGSGLNNVVMGVSNAGSITTGVENFIVGQGNLTLATSINRSTVSGQDNAKSVSSSNYNTFFGYANMFANTGTASYSFIAGSENLYSSIGNAFDNVIIGRGNGYTATAAALNATLLGRENGYNASSVAASTLIGWRNCYANTNALDQNNIIGYGNLYNVDSAILYNSVMGYHNAYNATDVDYCSLFGFKNAYNAGNLDYTSLFGRDNAYSSSSVIYTIMSGFGNAMNATSTITDSALFGRQNAENGFDVQYSIMSGLYNAREAEYVRNSALLGRENAYVSSSVQHSFMSGYRNAYTTTNNTNYSMLVGYQNGHNAGSLNNTILLGFEQGYSVGSQGAAAYRLAIGMYRDNPLIYGEFDNEVVKINGSLTVTDRTGGAATKSAFFDSTGQLIEGDPASTISFAISDETSNLTVGSGKLVFRMPYAMTITDVRASVTTPPTGSTIIVDIEQGGSSIFTTNLLSIDAGEKTSTTAATPPNITTTALNDDVEIIVNIDQVGSTVAGTGLKVYLIGTRA